MMLSHATRPAHRRGAILLVVMTLTALFAVIALSFALYSESAANSARINREAAATTDDPPPAAAMASEFLRQLVYPTDPTGTTNAALFSSLRGYDFAGMVYGNNPAGGNNTAYNGIGTFTDVFTNQLPTGAGGTIPTFDRRSNLRYDVQMPLNAGGTVNPGAVHVIDPEHTGFRNSTQLTISPGNTGVFVPGTPTAKAYVGRNAPYTYPDRNNAYLAVQDPTTGRILLPSFHRPSLFAVSSTLGTTAPPNLILDRSNPNWRDAADLGPGDPTGRYKILRPRPWDHRLPGETESQSQFPFPPLDPDGIARGDVQNIPNIEGLQQNDAVWIDAGLPVVTWRGKQIKALVAPTILALDGRVNVNVAGNLKGQSSQGFGPWEIGLGRVTGDAGNLISARTGGSNPSPRGTGLAAYPFPTTPQAYARVNWDGGDANSAPTIPTATTAAYNTQPYSNPTYPNPGYNDAVESGATVPQMFSPYTWNAYTSPAKLFSFSDLRRSSIRYSGRPGDYTQPYFLPPSTALTSLNQTGTTPGLNAARARVTTVSNSLAVAQLQPNFRDYASDTATGGRSLTLGAGNVLTVTGTNADDFQLLKAYTTPNTGVPGVWPPVPPPPAPTALPTWATDFPQDAATTAIYRYRSAMAALGPVNLNRTLYDYRTNPSLSLADPVNAGVPMLSRLIPATADRNQLAREIFIRLIAATGAKAYITGPTTVTLPDPAAGYTLTVGGVPRTVSGPEYDALRYLAQIAVNIVDLVDNDDINTPFVWNPLVPTDPLNVANFNPAELANRVVYGVEKPRLVINEAYSEVTNDPADRGQTKASMPFRVKFWLELLNTSNNENANTALSGIPMTNDPLAKAGNVPLSYNIPTPMGATPYSFASPAPAPYRLQVFQSPLAVTDLMNPTNITGAVTSVMPDIQVDSSGLTNATQPSFTYSIEPNNGQPQTAAGVRNGIAVVGPDVTPQTPPPAPNEYAPTDPTMLKDNDAAGVKMYYTIGPAMDAQYKTNVLDKISNHTVVLQRLANPYVPTDPTNPYLTVDYMAKVHSEDGVQVVQSPGGMTPGVRSATMPTAIDQRKSVGRIQPYMAAEGNQIPAGTTSRLPTDPSQSCVVSASQSVPPPAAPAQEPLTSMFRHNSQNYPSTGTMSSDLMIRMPFEWMPHFDRPLVNSMELLHTAVGRAHQVTHQFASIGATPPSNQHTVPWTAPGVPLYRGLELLSTKPWGYGLPDGGRVPGKININMIWDDATSIANNRGSVLEALLDQTGSAAGAQNPAVGFSSADVNSVYNVLFGSDPSARTKDTTNRVPSSTTDEEPAPGGTDTRDKPFKPFGTAAFAAGGLLVSDTGIGNTLLRNNTTTNAPALFRNPATTPHPYLYAEMLRKMHNNITTTSDTYLVVMTVGYFEVRNAGPYTTTNPPVLGKEVFNEVPTDLRSKFVAVVDRSMIATDNPTAATGNQVDGLWISSLNETPYDPTATIPPAPTGTYYLRFPAQGQDSAGKIQIIYEGRTFAVGAGDRLILGTGASQEVVTIAALGGLQPYTASGPPFPPPTPAPAFDATTGLATVTLSAPPALQHPAGSVIANATLGNPGPQSNFDVNQPRYKGVVPFFDRVTIGQ